MIQVLDHGFVRLVDHMGDDSRIVQAARVSYGAGTKTKREDEALIDYLMRNRHTSPMEAVVFQFHVKLPIFVARQFVRHRTARLNEVSLRYSEAKDEFYIPKTWRAQDTKNKQGSVVADLDHAGMTALLINQCEDSMDRYRTLINGGAAREMARMVLPINLYTEWYWQMDLHNLFHFLRLRLDAHAQFEAREYAKATAELVKPIVPAAWAAFERHQLAR